MRTPSRVSVRSLAVELGLSTATVSRALSRHPNVDPATRERVQAAAARAGFKPAQVKNRPKHIALLISLEQPRVEHYTAEILSGAMEYCGQMNLDLSVICLEPRRITPDELLRTMLSRHCDGVITALVYEPAALVRLRDAGIPVVVVSDDPGLPGVGALVCENASGMRRLTEYLLGLGHRRIALFCLQMQSSAHGERLKTFKRTLKAAGCYDERLVYPVAPSPDTVLSGVAMAEAFVRDGHPATAVICMNDEVAYGAMRVLRNAKISIPRAISVAGFDDYPMSLYVEPTLTTVRQPLRDMGRKGAETLFAAIQSGVADTAGTVFPADLIVRASTGRPAKA